MSIACPHSKSWIQKTLQCWILTSRRSVSTTSAINRGLRATKEADGGRGRRRDRGRVLRKDDSSGRDSREFKPRNFVSRGERNVDARDGLGRGRRGRTGGNWQSRSVEDGRKDSPRVKLKKFTSGGEEPDSAEFWTSGKAHQTPKDTNAASGRRTGGRDRSVKGPGTRANHIAQGRADMLSDIRRSASALPLTVGIKQAQERIEYLWGSPDKKDWRERVKTKKLEKNVNKKSPSAELHSIHDQVEQPSKQIQSTAGPGYTIKSKSRKPRPGKQHPQLHHIIAQLDPLLKEIKRTGSSRYTSESKAPKRLVKTESHKRILELLGVVNENMSTGEWPKRYVRDALNERRTKLHSWTLDTKGLWFDYENARLELVSEEDATSPKDKQMAKVEDEDPFDHGVREAGKNVRDEPSEVESAVGRLFEIHAPENEEARNQSEDTTIDDTPLSVPYTTAASTFIYGTNSVLAALKAKRRKLYKLHLRSRLSSREADDRNLLNLARKARVQIFAEAKLKLLDQMSEFRPHNGVVLEASKLPAPPVLALGQPDPNSETIPLQVARQSAEDIGVNGAPEIIPSLAHKHRKPFVVMLDGITDPGNVGSILRTCHFYGVDAVAIAINTCANLNSATLAKASSGACEAIPILALPKPSDFVYQSAKAGWKVFAAVAPQTTTSSQRPGRPPKKGAEKFLSTAQLATNAPLMTDPCILMLGAEGEGLRANLRQRADYFVSIEGGRTTEEYVDVGVDSLNVSAAASVLLESFMKRPEGTKAAVWRVMRDAERKGTAKTMEERKKAEQERKAKEKGHETTEVETVE